MSIRVKIQNIRKKLNNLLLKEVIPLRDEIHLLLKKEAVHICPFNLNDIITLENGKKGIITEIDYYSLDYKFYADKFISYSFKDDDILPEYLIDYSFDDKKFSITWEISGLRLRKNGE
ncbi:MAG: hypothetical protein PHP65_05500, partial [Bacilli bacterium]|nr:hypothetical protein [Bacilli bacterium]